MEEQTNLAITRRRGERVRIGSVWVTVVDVDRGKVRLSITADRDVPIHREELLPANERYFVTRKVGTKRDNQHASRADPVCI